jgi:ribosomal protein L13
MATATAMKTYQANAQDRERDWYVVDATGKTLGRLATQIADVLRPTPRTSMWATS